MTWLLILKLIFMLPGLITSIIEIYKLIKEFESTGFESVVALIKECVAILLGFPREKKQEAKTYVAELRKELLAVKGNIKNGLLTVGAEPAGLLDLKARITASRG